MTTNYILQVQQKSTKHFCEKQYNDLRLVKKAYLSVIEKGFEAIVFKNGNKLFRSSKAIIIEQ